MFLVITLQILLAIPEYVNRTEQRFLQQKKEYT